MASRAVITSYSIHYTKLYDLERLAAGEASTLFSAYFEEELLPRVAALRPRLISLSVNYRHQVLPAFELAGRLRRRLPGVPLVGGGGVFTSWRSTLRRLDLRFSPFDRIVFGPGDRITSYNVCYTKLLRS